MPKVLKLNKDALKRGIGLSVEMELMKKERSVIVEQSQPVSNNAVLLLDPKLEHLAHFKMMLMNAVQVEVSAACSLRN